MYGSRLYGATPYAGRRIFGRNFLQTLTETVVISDTIAIVRFFVRTLTETIVVTDTLTNVFTRAWQAVARILPDGWTKQSRTAPGNDWTSQARENDSGDWTRQ